MWHRSKYFILVCFYTSKYPRIKISRKKCIRRELNIIMEIKPPFKRFRSNRASMYTVLVPRYKLFAAVCKTAMRNERSCRTTLEWQIKRLANVIDQVLFCFLRISSLFHESIKISRIIEKKSCMREGHTRKLIARSMSSKQVKIRIKLVL